ncbi:unnamed protein product [Lepeophtheirus salmonis]|uniref:(salmon louse) hypothetical protein n=1 Tax=Lepeophtheirus salmonis TaxID=72036 RepID=A0A7R8D3R7_LEPSM|nr:unnamed protein product [Lepeophtheirus salmonis]CAF2967956.1 unnamed protein product [Lepeophtheirus salmonis]
MWDGLSMELMEQRAMILIKYIYGVRMRRIANRVFFWLRSSQQSKKALERGSSKRSSAKSASYPPSLVTSSSPQSSTHPTVPFIIRNNDFNSFSLKGPLKRPQVAPQYQVERNNLESQTTQTQLCPSKSVFSTLSFKKNRFRNNSIGEESMTSNSTMDKQELSAVNIGLYWRTPSPEQTSGKISISIMSCSDLPRRDYGGAVDCYVHLSVLKDRGRSLRGRNPPLSLSDWSTKTIRHSSNPVFDQTFTLDIPEVDFKSIRLKFTAYDVDRNTKTSEIGSSLILLRDIKLLTNNIMDQRINTTSFLAQKKQEYGELLFGMSYLPTAQRMSFSIVKASNLRYEAVAPSVDVFFPYVRILHLGSNHKIIKKKKTTIKWGKTRSDVNSIEMRELDSIAEDTFENIHEEERGSKDVCLGRICIGRRVNGLKERAHWVNVVQNPRKVFSTWQTLY